METQAAAEATSNPLEFESLKDIDLETEIKIEEIDFDNIDMADIDNLDALNNDPFDTKFDNNQNFIDKLREGKILNDAGLENPKEMSTTGENVNSVELNETTVEKGADIDFDTTEPTVEQNNQMKTEMKEVYDKIRTEVDYENLGEDAKKVVDAGLESIEEASGETIPDDIKEQIKDASEMKDVGDNVDTKLTEEVMNKVNETLKEINDKIAEGPEEGKSLSDRIKDIFKALIELVKILGPIFGMWFMFNLISYVFSEC